MLPSERQAFILTMLDEHASVSTQEVSAALHVSTMTVHRDMTQLAEAGRLQKVHGGAVRVGSEAVDHERCIVCDVTPARRAPMLIHLDNGEEERACCAHCGLLAIARREEQVRSALVPDFLFQQMVNAGAASYLLAPELTICCSPTVLAFAQHRDAVRFQQGFGGQVLSFGEALETLQKAMSLH